MAGKVKNHQGEPEKQEPVETPLPEAEGVEDLAQPETKAQDSGAAQPGTETNHADAAQSAGPGSYTLTADEFRKVQQHIEELQKGKEEAIALAQRVQADFDNFRKRNASVRKDSYDEGVRAAVTELLPVLDHFTMAVEAGDGTPEAWREGVGLVYRQFGETLDKLGLTEIPAEGKFDPRLHNAVAQEKAEGKESGEIVEVLRKGYRMGETIVRHSIVKVAE